MDRRQGSSSAARLRRSSSTRKSRSLRKAPPDGVARASCIGAVREVGPVGDDLPVGRPGEQDDDNVPLAVPVQHEFQRRRRGDRVPPVDVEAMDEDENVPFSQWGPPQFLEQPVRAESRVDLPGLAPVLVQDFRERLYPRRSTPSPDVLGQGLSVSAPEPAFLFKVCIHAIGVEFQHDFAETQVLVAVLAGFAAVAAWSPPIPTDVPPVGGVVERVALVHERTPTSMTLMSSRLSGPRGRPPQSSVDVRRGSGPAEVQQVLVRVGPGCGSAPWPWRRRKPYVARDDSCSRATVASSGAIGGVEATRLR